jgi:DNA replication protein DnaC
MDVEYGELKTAIEKGAIPLYFEKGFPLSCPNCEGKGLVSVFEITSGPFSSRPYEDGNLVTMLLEGNGLVPGWYIGKRRYASCPICRGGQIQNYLWSICGLADIDKEISLENFRILKGKEPARQVVTDLLAMKELGFGFITFWGTFGVGKSMLLKIIVNFYRKIGLPARYISLADLLANAREKFGESAGSVENVIDYYRKLPVLAVDEVDRVNLTPWAMETTYRLLDSRFNSRGELLTVVACNLSPLQMPENLGYLASRMRGGLVVEVGGADLRPAVALKERKDIDG